MKIEAGPERIAEWVAAAAGELAVFGGNAGLCLLDTLDQGVAGIAPGADVTDKLTAIYQLWRNGDAAGAYTRSCVSCRSWSSSRKASSTTTPAPNTRSFAGACLPEATCVRPRAG